MIGIHQGAGPPPASGLGVMGSGGWRDSEHHTSLVPSTPAPAHFSPGTAAVEELEDFINNINSVLESLYIEIKKGATEDDGRPVYALVSACWRPLAASVRSRGAPAAAALQGDTDAARATRATVGVLCHDQGWGLSPPCARHCPTPSLCPRQGSVH